jgi:hypothetical protein
MRFSLSPWKKELIYMSGKERIWRSVRERNFYLCIAREAGSSLHHRNAATPSLIQKELLGTSNFLKNIVSETANHNVII